MKPLAMNGDYFELFGLSPSFHLKQAQLDDVYHKIQTRLHPDRHVSAGPQQQRLAEQKSALVNEAYRVLSNDCERADYLLNLRGQTVEDQSHTTQDEDFLLEQMELRQALDECSDAERLHALQATITDKSSSAAARFAALYEKKDYAHAREAHKKMQFLARLQTQLDERVYASELEQGETA